MRIVRAIAKTLFIVAFVFLIRISNAQKPQFKVQVDLVSIDVEVLDLQGKPVEGLNQNDFVVKENRTPVEISNFASLSDVSISLVVALETSFMPQSNLRIAKNAISLLIHLLKPKDEICLYTFDQKDAYLEQGFTRDRVDILRALDNIGVASYSRRPNQALRTFQTPPQAGLGIDLGLAAAKKGSNQRKALLLIRDRVENLGPASADHFQESGCMLIALGFSLKAKDRLMLIKDDPGAEQLILAPGEPLDSGKDGDVMELCRTTAHLLSSRYTITYHTPLPELRGARQIEVLTPGYPYRILVRRNYAPPR